MVRLIYDEDVDDILASSHSNLKLGDDAYNMLVEIVKPITNMKFIPKPGKPKVWIRESLGLPEDSPLWITIETAIGYESVVNTILFELLDHAGNQSKGYILTSEDIIDAIESDEDFSILFGDVSKYYMTTEQEEILKFILSNITRRHIDVILNKFGFDTYEDFVSMQTSKVMGLKGESY